MELHVTVRESDNTRAVFELIVQPVGGIIDAEVTTLLELDAVHETLNELPTVADVGAVIVTAGAEGVPTVIVPPLHIAPKPLHISHSTNLLLRLY